jgi:diguanylate cyclase (GGDEF)-like protein
MCDIDHFKKVNDTYGHLSGDAVLKEFVRSIMELIRADSDWLARYGGEEFVLILPETHIQDAFGLAERLRKHIAERAIEASGDKLSITASFGVTGFNVAVPADKVTPETLIGVADRYLYKAKKKGRNKVICGCLA